MVRLSYILAGANLFYRDVAQVIGVVVTLWMFLTPVLYPIKHEPGLMAVLKAINPMTPIIEAYRSSILHGVWTWTELASLAWPAGLSIVLLAIGWLWFHKAEGRFAEAI